jgi:lantibiotic leader peptide-processing serine protease
MKRFAPLAVVSIVALAACADQPTTPVAPDLQPSLSTTPATQADQQLVVFGSKSIPAGFAARVAALGGRLEAGYDAIGVAVVSGLTDSAVAELAAVDGVASVDPDLEIQFVDPVGGIEVAAAGGGATSQTAPDSATFFPRQWHLRAIGADKAWSQGKLGSSSVTVAILDTGIDYTYPDLAGLVDLSRSKSFVPSDDALIAANFPGAHEVADLHYHGTHVAATVSSKGLVAAGVTSRTTLIGVKVLSASGSGSTSGVLAGIMYAADAGADVINMSLGGGFSKSLAGGFGSTLLRAVNYASQKGSLVVVAAGNDGNDLDREIILNKNGTPNDPSDDFYEHRPSYFASYCNATNVVCVSATGPKGSSSINGPWQDIDAPAPYTNFGRSAINVAAPGGSTGGRVTAGCSKFSLAYRICATGNYVLGANGTSMATPHVAGLAALLVAEQGRNRPAQIKAQIEQSADDLGPRGTDPYYGKGRVNVAKALGL